MNIKPNEIADKKRIGNIGTKPVFKVSTVGGLHLVVSAGGGRDVEVLGAGSHPGIARHLARKKAPDIEFTDLAKSEDVDPRFFEDKIAEFEALTDELRRANGDD